MPFDAVIFCSFVIIAFLVFASTLAVVSSQNRI